MTTDGVLHVGSSTIVGSDWIVNTNNDSTGKHHGSVFIRADSLSSQKTQLVMPEYVLLTRGLRRLSSKGQACTSRELVNKDWISELQDDILVTVFKFLTLKEAGRTSVLSKRWRHIWAYKRGLIFCSRKLFDDLQRGTKSLEIEGPKYLHWVDQVVSSYKAPTVNTFQVMFNISLLGESCSNSIDNWFRFAMEKKVKKLIIDFSLYHTKGAEFSHHTLPSLFSSNSLMSLRLNYVNVTGEILESFLRYNRALTYLSVGHSDSLERLRVSGPSLNLERLRIFGCRGIKQLEISAPKLVSIIYYGPKINVQLRNVPKLGEATFGYSYARNLTNICSNISSCISQIKYLSLATSQRIKYRNLSVGVHVFTRLRKLELEARLKWNEDLYSFMPLIKACPLLHHIIIWYETDLLDFNKSREFRKQEACPLKHLKVVEIMGFVGHTIDLEFAAYLMENAALTKIIVDTQKIPRFGWPEELEVTEERKQAMKRAEILHENRKPGTVLEIR